LGTIVLHFELSILLFSIFKLSVMKKKFFFGAVAFVAIVTMFVNTSVLTQKSNATLADVIGTNIAEAEKDGNGSSYTCMYGYMGDCPNNPNCGKAGTTNSSCWN
jgi:hypothetical protein